MRPTLRFILIAAALSFTASACDEYLEPPTLQLNLPPEGVFIEGDLMVLSSNHPFDPATLSIRIWQDARDHEGDLPPGLTPLLDTCTAATSPCGPEAVELVVNDDKLSATIQLDPQGIGRPDVPLLLEVLAGLEHAETGARVNRSLIYNFQFKPSTFSEEPVEFESGEYLIVGVITELIHTTLSFGTDIRVTRDNRVYIAGAELDEIAGASKVTENPDELFLDVTDQGFVIFAQGRIRQNDEGARFIETDPFEAKLLLAGLEITLRGMRFTAKVLPHPETGRDKLSGTISFEQLELKMVANNRVTYYDGGDTTFNANQIPPEQHIEGTPDICGELCGGVVLGQCAPPADWPHPGVCDDDDGTEEDHGDED